MKRPRRRRSAHARTRALVVVAALATAMAAGACAEDRERLDVPRVYLELDTNVVVPGDSVRGRISAGDDFGGIVRLAARICIDSGFQTARLNYDRADSASFRFLLPVPASTRQNALVIVEGQVNDEQSFFVTTQDTIVARSPDVPPGPSPGQPTCAR
jgi:hypothetical protein